MGVDIRQRRENLIHQNRGQAHGRLVQQENFRTGHQAARDGQHLLFAAAQSARDLRHAFLQTREQGADELEVLSDALFVLALESAHLQIFAYRQLGENAAALGHHHHAGRDQFVNLPMRIVAPVVDDRALSGPDQVAGRAQRSGLARAVGAD